MNKETPGGHVELKLMSRAAANHITADDLHQYAAYEYTASADGEIQPQRLTLTNTHCVPGTGGLCVFVCLCVRTCVWVTYLCLFLPVLFRLVRLQLPQPLCIVQHPAQQRAEGRHAYSQGWQGENMCFSVCACVCQCADIHSLRELALELMWQGLPNRR